MNRAEALQSVLQLMGEKEMYDYWSQTYRVHNLEWSQAKAADILDAWQKKFTQVTAARSGQEWPGVARSGWRRSYGFI